MGSTRNKNTQILTVSKNSTKNTDKQVAEIYKAVKFTSDLKTHEIVEEISKLNPQIYSNLTIFIIEHENFEFSETSEKKGSHKKDTQDLKRQLEKFHSNSSEMLLQLYSKHEKMSKFYHRENIRPFIKINCENFVQLVDDQLLNLMVENMRSQGLENREAYLKFFKTITKPRNFHKINELLTFKNLLEIKKLSQEEMLEDVKNSKIILIQDKKNSGKTWTLKSLSINLREKDSEKYTFYVDMKQFIDEFKPTEIRHEFEYFTANIITNSSNNFEAEVFRKLYKNGKVKVLIDNIHKISAELLTNTLHSFQQNGGNQLWIAARTDFEVNLKEKLKLDAVYKLDLLIKKPRCELIELCSQLLENEVKNNKSLEFHKTLWQNIRGYFDFSDIYQMIQHPVQRENDMHSGQEMHPSDVSNQPPQNESKILLTAIEHNTKDTSNDYLNQVRNDGKNIIHVLMEAKDPEKLQYFWNELRNLFESKDKFKELFNVKLREHPLHIAANCSELKFHETLWTLLLKTFKNREELKNLILQKNSFNNNFIHHLISYDKPSIIEFTFKKMKDNFNSHQYQEILQSKANHDRNLLLNLPWQSKTFETFQILWTIFQGFYQADKFLEIVKEVDDTNSNIFHIAAFFSSQKIFRFMVEEVERIGCEKDVQIFLTTLGLSRKNLLQLALTQNKSVSFHRYLWKTLNKFLNSNQILDMIKHESYSSKHLLFHAFEYNKKEIIESTWNEIRKIFIETGESELQNFLKSTTYKGENILHILINTKDTQRLKDLWPILEKFSRFDDNPELFRELFLQKTIRRHNNVLHVAAKQDKIEFHVTFWELLIKAFNNLEELKNLMLETNKLNNNFIHCLIDSDNPDIVEFTFKKIKDHFNTHQYQEILQSKISNSQNLLQNAASRSKNIKTLKILWKIFQDFYQADQFLEILKEVDDSSCNIFQIATCFTSNQGFRFMVVDFLETLGMSRNNLLQLALTQNKSASFHRYLWKILNKFLNSNQILDMIKHVNVNGQNILFHAFEYSTKEIIELTWNEIRKFMETGESELQNYLKSTNNEGENILHVLVNTKDAQSLEDLWPILEKFCRLDDNPELFRELFFQKTILRHDHVLHAAAKQKSIEFHNVFWELLIKTFNHLEELKNLIFQRNKFEDNFMTFLILCDNPDVIEFTFQKIKDNFSYNHYQDILHQQEYGGRNLLQYAACTSKKIKTHQVLWKFFQNSCKPTKEFLEIVKQVDDNGTNVIHYAACFATQEVFNFMINELKTDEIKTCFACFATQEVFNFMINELKTDEIKTILAILDQSQRNLLQLAARHNESLEFHQNLWKIIRNIFKSSEIVDMIMHTNQTQNNLMLDVVECNTKKIVEFTWNEVQKSLENENIQSQIKEFKGTDLMKASMKNKCNPDVNEYCKTILQDYEYAFKKKRSLDNSHLDNYKRRKI